MINLALLKKYILARERNGESEKWRERERQKESERARKKKEGLSGEGKNI